MPAALMPAARLARYESQLLALERVQQRRRLTRPLGLDFSSNDYLGLADSPRLAACVQAALERGVPVGAGGSRLLRGNHPEHEALEAAAAAFFGVERMLYLSNGYVANLAVLGTLPQPEDVVVYDELIHASAHAGIKAGRAPAVAVAHNEPQAFADALATWRRAGGRGHPWLVVESLYSMDGDAAPLSALAALAEAYDGFLYIDEAHASGVHGPGGRGLAAAAGLEGRDDVLSLHTCGKALGTAGALVGGSRVLIDFLVNRAKPFIYTTAPTPLQAVCVREALAILGDEPERRARLQALMRQTAQWAQQRLGYASGSQIQPVWIGGNEATLQVAAAVQAAGFDVRAIRPPSVPPGGSRLRIAITCHVDAAAIAALFAVVGEALEAGRC